jgi:hypothetical protein
MEWPALDQPRSAAICAMICRIGEFEHTLVRRRHHAARAHNIQAARESRRKCSRHLSRAQPIHLSREITHFRLVRAPFAAHKTAQTEPHAKASPG